MLVSDCECTIKGEYLFYGRSGYTTFSPSSNTVSMPTFYTPTGFYGSGYSDHDPTMHDKGAYIMQGDYLKGNGRIDTISYSYNLFGIWIYHIDGVIGEFMNQDIVYSGESYSGYFTLTGAISGGEQIIVGCMHLECAYFGKIEPGWNSIGIGGNYENLARYVCNADYCYDHYADTGTNYDSDFMPVYNEQRTLGCFECFDVNTEYIIHSFGLYEEGLWYTSLSYNYYAPSNSIYAAGHCNDGFFLTNEDCDEGDTDNGDGCSSTCTIEVGWECSEGGTGSLST
jgi:cysteine-rich repeat protein